MKYDFTDAFEWSGFDDFGFNFSSRGQYHLTEHDDHSILYVSAPGYKKNDITVEMQEGRLTIKGQPSTDKSVGVLVPKQIDLRFSVSPNHIVDNAELHDGILAIKLMRLKKTEAVKIPVLAD